MQFGLFEWVYIITSILGVYVIYRFMAVFFDRRRSSARVEVLSYIAYFLILDSIYLFVNIPIIMMIANLIAFFLLSLNYESTMKKRILSAVLIYLILVSVETIVVLLSGYFNTQLYSTNNYSSVTGIICCNILSYFAVLILNNFKNIKKGESVPSSYWLSIFLIPSGSLYLIIVLFNARGLSVNQVLIGLILIFLINIVTFHLYDVIVAALSDKMQNLLILEQNKYYDKQLETIKSSLMTTSAIRHDLKNHMFSIKALIEDNNTSESLNYISEIMDDIGMRKDFSTSGNTVIDSIINFKFQEAEQKNIRTVLDLKIPEKLEIPSFDITVILGNILDNAIKAAEKVKDNRYINLKMKYDKGRLLIQSDNPFTGKIREGNGEILTSNTDKENHGIGLQNIRKVIQKYDGIINIDYNDNIFSVSLLMYVD